MDTWFIFPESVTKENEFRISSISAQTTRSCVGGEQVLGSEPGQTWKFFEPKYKSEVSGIAKPDEVLSPALPFSQEM